MSRILNKLLCLIITITLVLPCCVYAAAEDEEGGISAAADLEEYIDATVPADDPDPVFGTMRLKVRAVLDSFDGASAGVSYDGNTLLRFESVEDTEAAYKRLCAEYGPDNVIVDLPLLTAESAPFGWGVDFMNIDDEMKRHTGSGSQNAAKVTVALIDSGIDSSHEIFSGKTISPDSKDFLGSDAGIADEEGHGTSVAGILAEATPANVELMILKTYVDGSSISMETVNQAIRYAADNGADVINLSMASSLSTGTSAYPEQVRNSIDDMEEQLQYARDKGSIIVASSGNRGGDMDSLMPYPASSENTITVGSVNQQGERSLFSNYGSAMDFCAPGEELYVAAYNSGDKYYTPALQPDNCSGTSFAAPYISACCAYVKMDDADAGNSEAVGSLKSKCVDYGDPGWDRYYGWGMPKYEDYVEAPDDAEEQAAREEAQRQAEALERKAKEDARNGIMDSSLPIPKISKPKSAGRKMTARWKKLSKKQLKKAGGIRIEVQYSTDRSFPADRTFSKTAGKKKAAVKIKAPAAKQKYYIRVRTYRNAGDAKYVSAWSKVKKIKIR